MTDLTPGAVEVLLRQHGVATGRQLTTAGISRSRRIRLLGTGVLDQVGRHVYRLAGTPSTLEQRCAAVSLSHPTGFITGPTGGMLRGLRRMPHASGLHLAVRHGIHLDLPAGIVLRQTTKIAAVDVEQRADGIRLARPARLAFDLAADLSPLDLHSVIDQLVHEHGCTEAQLVATARRLFHPARRGSTRFVAALAVRAGTPHESHPEVVVAERLLARGVPVVVQTTWLDLPNGRRARLDMSVPALRWGVEVDVHPGHLGLTGTTGDKGRDRQCHLIGWQVERVTSLDLTDLDGIIDELVALYEARRTDLAA
jgi:hypothetical protein